MYGPLRLLYDLPSRRKKERPQKLKLKVKFTSEQEWEYVLVEQERYPFLITFPYLGAPGIILGTEKSAAPGPVTKRMWIRGGSPSYDFMSLLQTLATDLKVHSLMPESHADVPSFCRLLAKIAHSFAVAEIGLHSFKSAVANYARGDDLTNCLHYIGSRDEDEPAADSLHELSIFGVLPGGSIVVRIRLLSKLGTPTYYVVVGEPVHGPQGL
jgi:hypothetical protein